MKKLLILAIVAGGVAFAAVKRSQDAKKDADLWREATSPSSATFGGSTSNGSTPAAATDATSTN